MCGVGGGGGAGRGMQNHGSGEGWAEGVEHFGDGEARGGGGAGVGFGGKREIGVSGDGGPAHHSKSPPWRTERAKDGAPGTWTRAAVPTCFVEELMCFVVFTSRWLVRGVN